MSSTKPTGGPVFPALDYSRYDERDGTIDHFGTQGMLLRDYFAAKAMQSQLHGYVTATADNEPLLASIAENAYAMADAMLAARAEVKPCHP